MGHWDNLGPAKAIRMNSGSRANRSGDCRRLKGKLPDHLRQLVQTLRDELRQYGKLLGLLERPHPTVANRSGRHNQLVALGMNSQFQAIRHAQCLRLRASRNVATHYRLKDINPIEGVLPMLPTEYQPLIRNLYHANREKLKQLVSDLVSQKYSKL